MPCHSHRRGAKLSALGENNTLRVRKNLQHLPDNDVFFEQYGEAVRRLHELKPTDARYFFNQATIHANYCKHGDINFFSWHRPYVAMYEEICGEIIKDSSFAMPYWDWSANQGRMPAPYYNNKLLNVVYWKDKGQYTGKNWGPVNSLPDRADLRSNGLHALFKKDSPNPFTQEFLGKALQTPNFSLFHNIIETQPHNNAHVIAGTLPNSNNIGHMGDGLSPLDPIFWNHHCMVDFMWAKWQSNGNTTQDRDETFSGMFCDKSGNAISFTNRSVRDFYSLGYTYDLLVPKLGASSRLESFQAETPEQLALAKRLEANLPQSLGAQLQTINVTSQQATHISIKAEHIATSLQGRRVILQNNNGATELRDDQKRVYAVLKGVSWPKNNRTDFLVNVAVLDKFAGKETILVMGSFSFFGSAHMMHHGHDIVIDITDGLIQLNNAGRIKDEISIQLSTQSSHINKAFEANFDLQGIEIITL